jgi:hypothetical protein
MEPKTEGRHAASFIMSEANGNRSRETVLIAEGEVVTAGQVIAKRTSGSFSGDYVAFDQDGNDGSETPIGIAINGVDATDAAVKEAIIARDAEVNGDQLGWPDDIEGSEKEDGVSGLADLGIIVRLLIVALALGWMMVGGTTPEQAGLAMALVGLGMLDVFKGSAFDTLSLTDAINEIPFVPGRAGMLIPWRENGVNTLSIAIEQKAGVLSLINPSPRGGPGEAIGKQTRSLRMLRIPHYQRDDAIMADEVQGVRAFGSETELETVQGKVNERMAEHVDLGLDPTLEYQRVGAVKGVILNADGSTLMNLFTEFDVSQAGEIDFDLDNATPASGALRAKCAAAVRLSMDALGGLPVVGLHAFCGDTFFDQLLAHKEVVASYLTTPMAQVLREGYVYPNGDKVYGAFEFGGIVWENYRGKVNGSPIIEATKAHIFPIGNGLFRTVYAPADYNETVNTLGLPRYAKQFPMPNDKGVSMEIQSNALNYCTRPLSLLKGKNT